MIIGCDSCCDTHAESRDEELEARIEPDKLLVSALT